MRVTLESDFSEVREVGIGPVSWLSRSRRSRRLIRPEKSGSGPEKELEWSQISSKAVMFCINPMPPDREAPPPLFS